MKLSLDVIEISLDLIKLSLDVIEISANLDLNCLHSSKYYPNVPTKPLFLTLKIEFMGCPFYKVIHKYWLLINIIQSF